jgi:hypothetical protein
MSQIKPIFYLFDERKIMLSAEFVYPHLEYLRPEWCSAGPRRIELMFRQLATIACPAIRR